MIFIVKYKLDTDDFSFNKNLYVSRRFNDFHRLHIFIDRCLLEGKTIQVERKDVENG